MWGNMEPGGPVNCLKPQQVSTGLRPQPPSIGQWGKQMSERRMAEIPGREATASWGEGNPRVSGNEGKNWDTSPCLPQSQTFVKTSAPGERMRSDWQEVPTQPGLSLTPFMYRTVMQPSAGMHGGDGGVELGDCFVTTLSLTLICKPKQG